MTNVIEGFNVPKSKNIFNLLCDFVFVDERVKSRADVKRLLQQGAIKYYHLGETDWIKITDLNQSMIFENNPKNYFWVRTDKKGSTFLMLLQEDDKYNDSVEVNRLHSEVFNIPSKMLDIEEYLKLPELSDEDYSDKLTLYKNKVEECLTNK